MKTLLFSLMFLLPVASFAETISFNCVSVDVPGVHKFDANGIVNVDDYNSVEGIITVVTQKADSIQSVQTFNEVRVTGYIRHYQAGEVSAESFDQLVLKTNEAYLKSLNLLLGLEEKIASRVLSIDNFSYRSNCKIINTVH